jgi:hypothetical protein
MNLWTFFWIAFAAFVIFLLAKRSSALFTPEWYSIVHKLLYVCLIGTVALYIADLVIVKSGNPPNDLVLFLYRSCLWSLPIVAIVRGVQWYVINYRQRTAR